MSTKIDEMDAYWARMGGGIEGPADCSKEELRENPASRPGTGQRVIWRNEVYVVSPWMRCFACGWYKNELNGGRCACGGLCWVNLEPAAPPPPRQRLGALGEDSPGLRVDHYAGCAIATVLEGIGRGMTILLVGTAGVGKSTLAAQAGFVIAQQLGRRLYWLDADQLKSELIAAAFLRAGCPQERLRDTVIPVYREHPNGTPDAKSAIASVPKDGLLVVDSLEAWAPRGDKQALEVLRLLRSHPARVKLVVAATNAGGGVAGDGELERAGDATVFVERTRIRVGKCRWTLGATWSRRGPAGLDVERLTEDISASAAQAEAREPDFSLEGVEQAARWSAREIEAYRAKLRARGVPRDTIIGWDRAVDEQRAAQVAVETVAPPVQSDLALFVEQSEIAPLSERTRTAHAKLLRSWPWKEARVRASAIAQALLVPGLEDLGAALRELLGVSEESILNPAQVGNALKIVRGVCVDGLELTRDLDRRGVAWWRLATRGTA